MIFRTWAITEEAKASPSDLIAIAAAASAVLFPVLLIIVQKEPETTVSGVSNPGSYSHSGVSIPVYHMFLRGKDAVEGIIVADASAITVMQFFDEATALIKSGFTFAIIDPKHDIKLRENLVGRNPDWLAGAPDDLKPQLAGKYVWMKLLEKVRVEVSAVHHVLVTIPVEETENSDE